MPTTSPALPTGNFWENRKSAAAEKAKAAAVTNPTVDQQEPKDKVKDKENRKPAGKGEERSGGTDKEASRGAEKPAIEREGRKGKDDKQDIKNKQEGASAAKVVSPKPRKSAQETSPPAITGAFNTAEVKKMLGRYAAGLRSYKPAEKEGVGAAGGKGAWGAKGTSDQLIPLLPEWPTMLTDDHSFRHRQRTIVHATTEQANSGSGDQKVTGRLRPEYNE